MGNVISEPKKDKTTIHQKSNGIQFCSSEMQGWRIRMQDFSIHEADIGDGNALFGVFDGHEGNEVSQFVGQNFLRILKTSHQYRQRHYKQALDYTFKTIDEMIQSKEGQSRLKQIRGENLSDDNAAISEESGCSANVVLITKNSYFVANIGNSKTALRKGTTCVQLSQSHMPESEQEQQRIHKAGGFVIDGRINAKLPFTRSFGYFRYKCNQSLDYSEQIVTCKPDILEYDKSWDDLYIIMGSNGVWDRYAQYNTGLLNLIDELNVSYQKNIQQVTEELLETLIAKEPGKRFGYDNMTAILIMLKQ